jgi:hypothetical protein
MCLPRVGRFGAPPVEQRLAAGLGGIMVQSQLSDLSGQGGRTGISQREHSTCRVLAAMAVAPAECAPISQNVIGSSHLSNADR